MDSNIFTFRFLANKYLFIFVLVLICAFFSIKASAANEIHVQPTEYWYGGSLSVDSMGFVGRTYNSLGELISAYNTAGEQDRQALIATNRYGTYRTATGGAADVNSQKINGDYSHYFLAAMVNYVNYNPAPLPVITTVGITRAFKCPDDYNSAQKSISSTEVEIYCYKPTAIEPPPQVCQPQFGNPINAINNDKHENEIDFSTSDGLLKLERNYLNQREGWVFGGESHLVDLTNRKVEPVCYNAIFRIEDYDWVNHKTVVRLKPVCYSFSSSTGLANEVLVQASNSSLIRFVEAQGIFKADNFYGGSLVIVDPISNNGANWRYTSIDNIQRLYNAAGHLIRKILPNGDYLNYNYASGMLHDITDSSGRTLTYSYVDKKLMSVVSPDGSNITYTYDELGLLTRVTWPNGSHFDYLYNETDFLDPVGPKTLKALTGKIDENGNRNGTYKYDSTGKAISTERAAGIDKYTFSGSTVTDPLGSSFTMTFKTLADGTKVVSSQSQPAGSGCAASTKNLSYTTTGLVSSKTEFNGNITLYGYNATSNLEDRRVEGVTGSPNASLLNSNAVLPTGARKISTEWHPSWRKATRVAEPRLITTSVYHGQPDPFIGGTANCAPAGVTAALLCKKVEQATTDLNGASGFSSTLDSAVPKREWRYTYNALGKPLTTMTPIDIAKSTSGSTFDYYTSAATNWKSGDLKQTTNALGHITQYLSYDANGRLLEMIKPDGAHQSFTYDLRGRLKTSSLDSVTTSYTYDLAGNLTGVSLPNNTSITYGYDAAHRLTRVTDNLGNRIDYTLDNAGNITNTVLRDSGGTLRYQQQKVYDALSRVQNLIDTQNNQTTYLYDANGNPTGETDPKQHSTSHQFDALDQLKLTTDALNGKTEYGYDGQGNITQVKDANSHATTYSYNAFGDLVQQISPDTGTTIFTYDTAGNRTSAKDARNVVVNYTYDALNRLTTVTYPAAASENVTYTYDSTANGSYGVGRLSSVATTVARNDYVYDHLGLIVKKFTQLGSTLTTLQYGYDNAGNLTSITYPSGRIVSYARDTAGRIQGITTKANATATAQTIASAITYLPFGPTASYTYGNGLTHTNTFDTDYRLKAIQVGGVLSRAYNYDLADNITGITDNLAATKNQTLGYDALDRLTSAQGVYGALGYSYDAVGNRQTETAGGATATYTYDTTNNRLNSITRTNANRSFLYDVAGNRLKGTSDALKVQDYTYNNTNRLSTVKDTGTLVGTYAYNALGQRVSKVAGSVKEMYHYDEAGQLIAVTDTTGKTVREYIYNGSQLVSFVTVVNPAIPSLNLAAAQAALQGSLALSKVQTGYSGSTGYLQFNGEGQVSWTVNIVSPATYSSTIRYALIGSDKPLALWVDGVQKAIINFPATANLNTWGSVRVSVDVPLTAGAHTYTLKTTGSGGPNIDKVGVGAVSGSTGAPISTLYYVHNDHHSTPQVVTAQNQSVVWMADYQPFGKLQATTNSLELYARFPGQFVDLESGLYYNYFRDYDPSIGRYIESDPIGLNGGINTYAYVGGNPISFTDPYGLKKWDWDGWGDTSVCSYYEDLAKKTCSKYYQEAAKICKGQNAAVNAVMTTGIAQSWASDNTDASQSAIANQIRQSLINSDQTARALNNRGNSAPRGDHIDQYHNAAFQGAGINPFWYGGNLWPQGVWPNPVPYDPVGNSQYDPRSQTLPSGDQQGDQCGCSQ